MAPLRPTSRRARRARRPRRTPVVVALLVTVVAVALAWRAGSGPADLGGVPPVVTEVVDGDTVRVHLGHGVEVVRLIGIDTPETKHPTRPVGCFGPEASARTAELLPPGTEVTVERDREERDAYGRLLGYVVRRADGLFVNLELARGGYADVLNIAPNTAHAGELAAAVTEARREGRGLWSACPGAVPSGP